MSGRRSPSPSSDARSKPPTKPKEFSFYKKSHHSGGGGSGPSSSGAVGSFSTKRDPLERLDAKRRQAAGMGMEDVPGRYGGSRGEYGGGSGGGSRDYGRDERDRDGGRDRYGASGTGRKYDDRPRDRDRDRESERERSPRRDRDRDRQPTRRSRSRSPGQTGGYNLGHPLTRVETRDERPESEGGSGRRGSQYVGGEELGRVRTRDEPGPGSAASKPAAKAPPAQPSFGPMIEIIANDRLGRKVRVKCLPSDTVGDLKKLIAAQTGTTASKIQLKKWYTVFKDHIELRDYEIHDGQSLEMY